jgi:hypothetical protein
LSSNRDHQRSRVYAWENSVVAPRDPSFILFSQAQGIVDAIWAEMGLHYPPEVEPLPRQAKKTIASANRLSIFLPDRTPSWCLLHELAHAMTSTVEDNSDGHSENFMGIYVRLLSKYLRMNAAELVRSITIAGIDMKVDSLPSFHDL